MLPKKWLATVPDGLFRAALVENPSVSVIIPTHNRAAILPEAIESVLALGDDTIEVIVVDDGSTDETLRILKQIDDPRFSFARFAVNRGANTARNVGISLARAPFVAFLDSDDIYLSGRLEEPLSILRQHPDVGIVLSAFSTEKKGKRTLFAMPQRCYEGEQLERLVARHILQPTTSGLTVRKDVLAAVEGFDPDLRWMEDRDLVMRIARRSKGATIATPLWHKRWRPDGISSNRATYFTALLAFIARHPIYQGDELEFRNYLIARHLISLASKLRFSQLKHDYDAARAQLSPPPPSLPYLLVKYCNGRRRRRTQQRQLRRPDGAPEQKPAHQARAVELNTSLQSRTQPHAHVAISHS